MDIRILKIFRDYHLMKNFDLIIPFMIKELNSLAP